MIYVKQIGTECYCVDPVKIDDKLYDIEITKLTIKFIGESSFIPAEHKQLTGWEVSYSSVYPTLETAVEHATSYLPKDTEFELVDLGRGNWRIDLKQKLV